MTAKVGNWIHMNDSGAIGEVIEAAGNSWRVKFQSTHPVTSQAKETVHDVTQWCALGTFTLIAKPGSREFVCCVEANDAAGIKPQEFIIEWQADRVPDMIITPEGLRLVSPGQYLSSGNRYRYTPALLVCDLRDPDAERDPS